MNKPSRSRSQAPADPAKAEREAVRHERVRQANLAKQRMNVLSVISLIVIVIAGIATWWIYTSSEQEAEAARTAHSRAVNELRDEMLKLDLREPAGARTALSRLQATKDKWSNWPEAGTFADLLGRAESTVKADDLRLTSLQSLTDYQNAVQQGSADLAGWRTLHGNASPLEAPAKQAGAEAVTALHQAKMRAARGLHDALLQAAGTEKDARAAAALLVEAEDVVIAAAALAKGQAEATAEWAKLRETLHEQVEKQLAAAFDDKAVAATAWSDLVPGTAQTDWLHSTQNALEVKIVGGVLQVNGPAADAKGRGAATLHGHEWHACELDLDLVLDSGSVHLLLRMGDKTDPKTCMSVHISPKADKNVFVAEPGKKIHLNAVVIGDHLVLTSDVEPKKVDMRVSGGPRKGGFGIVTAPGTRLQISNMKIRKLI